MSHTGTDALGKDKSMLWERALRDGCVKNSEVNLCVPGFRLHASPHTNDLKRSAVCIVKKQSSFLSKGDHLCCKPMFNCINCSGWRAQTTIAQEKVILCQFKTFWTEMLCAAGLNLKAIKLFLVCGFFLKVQTNAPQICSLAELVTKHQVRAHDYPHWEKICP